MVELSESQKTDFFCSHLLLAEDDPVCMQITASCLEALGYTYDVVKNGHEALLALAERDYGLVLMDCMMPIIGGFEATGIIRDPESNVRCHTIPVIALTGMAEEDLDYCLDAGMNDYLPKPVRIDNLIDILVKWLPGSPQTYEKGAAHKAGLQVQFINDEAVLALFAAKAPEYAKAIQESLTLGTALAMRQHAHKLAGAAAAIGARNVAELAAEIEVLGADNDIINAAQKVLQLSEALEKLLTILTRHSNT